MSNLRSGLLESTLRSCHPGMSRFGLKTCWVLLFVCALIGFANSNPTLRQMFDAIR